MLWWNYSHLAENGMSSSKASTSTKPDLVFLDIEMPGMNGLEVVENVSTKDARGGFATAYNEHAIRAFELNA
ncbi:MAG: response regulator [Bacteroidia bacterium]